MRYRDAARLVDSIRHKDLSEKTKTLLLGVSGGISAILLIQRFVIEPISHIININNIENGKITEQQFIDKIKKLYRVKAKTLYSTLVESDMYPDEANKFGGLTFANMNEYRNAQKRIENARSVNDLVAIFPNSTYLKKAQAAFAQRMMNRDSRIFDYGVKGMKKGVRKKKETPGIIEQANREIKNSQNALERVHNKTTERTRKKSQENLQKMKGAKGVALRAISKIGAPAENNSVMRKVSGVQMGLGMTLGRKLARLFK